MIDSLNRINSFLFCIRLLLAPSPSPSNTSNGSTQLPIESDELNSTTSNTNISSSSSCSEMSSPQPTTALLLDQSSIFGARGANVFVVTMDQRQPLLEFTRYVYQFIK